MFPGDDWGIWGSDSELRAESSEKGHKSPLVVKVLKLSYPFVHTKFERSNQCKRAEIGDCLQWGRGLRPYGGLGSS